MKNVKLFDNAHNTNSCYGNKAQHYIQITIGAQKSAGAYVRSA